MRIEQIEAKPYHVGRMVRQLRSEHLSLLGDVPTHRELRDMYDASIMRRAWLFNGVLGAMAGIHGSIASGDGLLWMAVSEEATRYPVHIARGAIRYIDEVMRMKHRLVINVLMQDRAGVAFAYFLGFRVDERNVKIRGIPAFLMSCGERKAA